MAAQSMFFFDVTKVAADYTGSRDVSIITNTNAVVESLHNLILTQPGERLMNPQYGMNLYRYLFEPVETSIAGLMCEEIKETIERFEPRCKNVSVTVTPLPDDNTFDIQIFFTTSMDVTGFKVNVQLNKIR